MKTIFDGFKLHDELGLPLTVTISEGRRLGFDINLAAFCCDAAAAGWTEHKIKCVLGEASNDNGIPFTWDSFREKIALLWTITGASPDPICWQEMKQYVMDALKRNAA